MPGGKQELCRAAPLTPPASQDPSREKPQPSRAGTGPSPRAGQKRTSSHQDIKSRTEAGHHPISSRDKEMDKGDSPTSPSSRAPRDRAGTGAAPHSSVPLWLWLAALQLAQLHCRAQHCRKLQEQRGIL